jgi:hypothetical protein
VVLLDGSATSLEIGVEELVRSVINKICSSCGIEGMARTYGLLHLDSASNFWIAENQILHELVQGNDRFRVVFCKRFLNPLDPIPVSASNFDAKQSYLRCLSDFMKGKFEGQLGTNVLKKAYSLLGDQKLAQALSPRPSSDPRPSQPLSPRQSVDQRQILSPRAALQPMNEMPYVADFDHPDAESTSRTFATLLSKASNFGAFEFPADYFRPSDAEKISDCKLIVSPSSFSVICEKEQRYQIPIANVLQVLANGRTLSLNFVGAKGAEKAATVRCFQAYVVRDSILGYKNLMGGTESNPTSPTASPRAIQRRGERNLAGVAERLRLAVAPITDWLRKYPSSADHDLSQEENSAISVDAWTILCRKCESFSWSTSAVMDRAQIAESFSNFELDFLLDSMIDWGDDFCSLSSDFILLTELPDQSSFLVGYLLEQIGSSSLMFSELVGKLGRENEGSIAPVKAEIALAERTLTGTIFALQAAISGHIPSIAVALSLSLCLFQVSHFAQVMLGEARSLLGVLCKPTISAALRYEVTSYSSVIKWVVRLLDCLCLVQASARPEPRAIVAGACSTLNEAAHCLFQASSTFRDRTKASDQSGFKMLMALNSLKTSLQLFSSLLGRPCILSGTNLDSVFLCNLRILLRTVMDVQAFQENPTQWMYDLRTNVFRYHSSAALLHARDPSPSIILDYFALEKAMAQCVESLIQRGDHRSSFPLLDILFGKTFVLDSIFTAESQSNLPPTELWIFLVNLLRSVFRHGDTLTGEYDSTAEALDGITLRLLNMPFRSASDIQQLKASFDAALDLTDRAFSERPLLPPLLKVTEKAEFLLQKSRTRARAPTAVLTRPPMSDVLPFEGNQVHAGILLEELEYFLWTAKGRITTIPTDRLTKLCLTTFPYWTTPAKILETVLSQYAIRFEFEIQSLISSFPRDLMAEAATNAEVFRRITSSLTTLFEIHPWMVAKDEVKTVLNEKFFSVVGGAAVHDGFFLVAASTECKEAVQQALLVRHQVLIFCS